MARKKRIPIPDDVAAQVMFEAHRTCCVCRVSRLQVEIHHIDDDPANNDPANLAVLCKECHSQTQMSGGFARKLNADLVMLYKAAWVRAVTRDRAGVEARLGESLPVLEGDPGRMATLAEIYGEREEYELLAIHYDACGNMALRDKYVEKALQRHPTDESHFFLRRMQGRLAELPEDVRDRMLAKFEAIPDYTQVASYYESVGDTAKAAESYVRVVSDALREGRPFSAALYLRRVGTLVDSLLKLALTEAQAAGHLWWEVRALQELGWDAELKARLLERKSEILVSSDVELRILLARVEGDEDRVRVLQEALARRETLIGFEGAVGPEAGDRHEDGTPVD